MSYCRWSSDDFGCDLYCYESAEGYVTHVAGSRPVGDVPKVTAWPPPGGDDPAAVANWSQLIVDEMQTQHAFLMKCERAPIGLAFDGETFTDRTLQDFHSRLVMLRANGYRFPDGVLQTILDEIAGERAEEDPTAGDEAFHTPGAYE